VGTVVPHEARQTMQDDEPIPAVGRTEHPDSPDVDPAWVDQRFIDTGRYDY